jgi:uncharacterized protein with beta-barrel porin domain
MRTIHSSAWRQRSFWCSTAATAALGLTMLAPASSVHAQAPPLGTVATFGVLAGTTVTNTGPTVINGTAANPGNVGVSPGAAVVGFPPGILAGPGATFHVADAIALQAQVDLTNAYNTLAARPATANLTGQNLGGLTLTPGVYSFNNAAQLTGALTLNGLGNPNAVFIFNIGSALTTSSASVVNLINGAQGASVFWRVGSSATLGTTSSFAGDILANTSITLNTGARITCGAAWARTGAVTLDTNTIALCDLIAAAGGGGPVLLASLLPAGANTNQLAVATAIDTFVARGGVLPIGFLNLFNLSPADLANALTQIQGETGTGFAQAGVQAMNSFLSLVTNPFADNRGFASDRPSPPPYYKAPAYKAINQADDPRRWSVWAAGYGGESNLNGNAAAGSHDLTARSYGIASGLDYRVTPYTVVGFALGGGGTNFGLANGLGSGRSDMFQAAIYGLTRVNAAYVSAAIAYGWHQASTDRIVTVAGVDHLTADFSANNIGGRIEGGYRFALPGVLGLTGFGLTPYAALQMQAIRTPSYSESAISGSSVFALSYDAHTTTVIRTELGSWFDRPFAMNDGAILSLRSRAAWAHDDWSNLNYTAGFLSLPGSSWTVTGAPPARDLLLASGVAEINFRNGFSLAGEFDTELSPHTQTYSGTARLRYRW